MPPNQTIPIQAIHSVKDDKTQIPIAFFENADGSKKLEPFFISHVAKPQPFKKKTGGQLAVYYRNNKKAWTTLRRIDQKTDDHFKSQGCHILLLVDNMPSHIFIDYEPNNVHIKVRK
jgi:hypothetical protein